MGKYQLERPWDWNERAEMYYNNERPTRTDYPFWWYKVEGDDIYLIKQITKFWGVIHNQNKYVLIEDESLISNLAKKHYLEDVDNETAYELERRSWMTLGEVDDLEKTPSEVVISYEGGGGCIYKFHPVHGRIVSCIWVDADGVIIYKSIFEYNHKHYAVKHGNSLGDRWSKDWDKQKEKYIWKKW